MDPRIASVKSHRGFAELLVQFAFSLDSKLFLEVHTVFISCQIRFDSILFYHAPTKHLD